MFWACQRFTSKGMVRRVSAMASAVARASAAGRSPAAAASRRTMARFMRWPAVKLRSGVSRAIWSAAARARRASISVGVEVVGLDGAAEAGVDGEAGGEGERGRRGHAGLGEEVQERGVVLVDLAEGVLHLGEGLVEDGVEDAVLLVGEERGEGVGGVAEEAIDEADDLGEIGAADGGADVGGEGGEGVDFGGVFGVVALDGGGEVLVAEMEDGEADVFGLLGDAGADEGAAEGDACRGRR